MPALPDASDYYVAEPAAGRLVVEIVRVVASTTNDSDHVSWDGKEELARWRARDEVFSSSS